MKWAVLRAVIFGGATALTVWGLIESVRFADGFGPMPDDGLWMVIPLWATLAALAGYASHPLAKAPPPSVVKAIDWFVKRWVVRLFIGAAAGVLAVIGIYAVTILIGFAVFFLEHGKPARMPPTQFEQMMEILVMFFVFGACGGAMAAGILTALLAPGQCEERVVARSAIWGSIVGTLAGVWLSAGAGMILILLARRYPISRSDDVAGFLALGTGAMAGVFAILYLRWYRRS
jgi:hypothetical protein